MSRRSALLTAGRVCNEARRLFLYIHTLEGLEKLALLSLPKLFRERVRIETRVKVEEVGVYNARLDIHRTITQKQYDQKIMKAAR